MITLRLYGRFKTLASRVDYSKTVGIMEIEENNLASTISELLEVLDIKEDDIGHIFLNGEYSGLNRIISDGDRLAIFPKDMELLYRWYFKKVGK